jgi:hypothetical protein
MCLVAHPLTHENDRCRGERPLARVRLSINIGRRPAGRPYKICLFRSNKVRFMHRFLSNIFPVRYVSAGLLWIMISALPALRAAETVLLHGSVVDEAGVPVSGLEVDIESPSGLVQSVLTDMAGRFEVVLDSAGEYRFSLNKTGFFRVTNQPVQLQVGVNEVTLTINHETEIHEQVEVYSSSENIEPLDTSREDALIAREIRDIPVASTHDLRSSLEALPEVVRDQSGEIHVAGGRVGETQFLLDGFDIGDPVDGSLSARINVDSVRAAEVESGRFGIQYGHGGTGVLSLDTTPGDDRWRAGATNFVPGISVQRGLHLTSWYPRLRLSGPLRKGKAWFSDALSLQHTLSLVEELPPDSDSVSQWAGDNLLQTQIKLTPRNFLQGNFLYNQQSASNLGLGPFAPISTTRNTRSYSSFVSVKDQIWSARSFYEFGVAVDMGHSESLPHGTEPYVVTPSGRAGNYFEALRQRTRRLQGFLSITLPGRRWQGTHDLQFGFDAIRTGWMHDADRNPIKVIGANDAHLQDTYFFGTSRFHLTNASAGGYGMDTWRVAEALVFQLALRADWDRILDRATPSPRISANFLPFRDNRSKITAAWGVFLQPVTLSILGPAFDQQRSDTFLGPDATAPAIGPITSRFVLPDERLKQPRFYVTSVGWEQKIKSHSQAGINFIQRSERLGLAYERVISDPLEILYILQNNRRDRYRSVEVSFRHSFSDKAALSASYTRSSARTNQVFDYSLDTLVIASQQPGPMAWDAPNRFISSGWTPVSIWNLLLSYFFEYRTGFPFSVVNERQQLIGPANGSRFPDYIGLDVGMEKRIRLLGREWAIRLTIHNLTGHENPDSVINNVDSPEFMKFGGGQKRALSARLRLVG